MAQACFEKGKNGDSEIGKKRCMLKKLSDKEDWKRARYRVVTESGIRWLSINIDDIGN